MTTRDSTESPLEVLSKEYPDAIKKKNALNRLLEQFETGRNRSVAAQQSLETRTQTLGKQVVALEELFTRSEDGMEKTTRVLWDR